MRACQGHGHKVGAKLIDTEVFGPEIKPKEYPHAIHATYDEA